MRMNDLEDLEMFDLEDETDADVIDNEVELTMLIAVEQVVEVMRNSKLKASAYEAAKRPIDYLAGRLQLTSQQAMLYAVFMNMFYDDSINMGDICRYLDITPLNSMHLIDDVKVLEDRNLIYGRRGDHGISYRVDKDAIMAMRENRDYAPKPIDNLTEIALLEKIAEMLDMRSEGEIAYDSFVEEVDKLLDANDGLHFVQRFRDVSLLLSQHERVFFIALCVSLVVAGNQRSSLDSLRSLYSRSRDFIGVRRSLLNGSSQLIKSNLVQVAGGDSMLSRDVFELTKSVVDDLLRNLAVDYEVVVQNDIIVASSITPKQLFYNKSESAQISRLGSLLQPERFRDVCKSLGERGFRNGFACLFYGAPGTGKTETVMQLARMTGRNIMQVNLSNIRDKYVGESEKNVKAIFDRYRKLVESSDIAPILLFNEADAIISKRTSNVGRSVDKMENAIQNIILEQLESLNGILIATTNLVGNMDKAFERRFLYKVEFSKPSKDAMSAIWRSMIPELSEEDAMTLASKYNFSGGQIENIARKNVVDAILLGENISLDALCRHCDAEQLGKAKPIRRIGFQV